ncbi:MAG: hypothetical protein ACI82G_002809, partial [Bradymonadia bacterium]
MSPQAAQRMELALQHVSQEPGDRGGGVDADRTAALPTA